MKIWLFAAAASAVTVPGAPPLPPHMHYEIRLLDSSKLSGDDLLQGTCDAAEELMDDLKKQRHPTSAVKMDARTIRDLACRTYTPVRPRSK